MISTANNSPKYETRISNKEELRQPIPEFNMSRNDSKAIGKRIVCLSTYPPRDCGIASFTKDLIDSISQDQKHHFSPSVIAINEEEEINKYDRRVKWSIERSSVKDYIQVAKSINKSNVDLVIVQHEFGIFGGDSGEYLAEFYDKIQKPVVTTLHTVLPNYTPKQLKIIKAIAEQSEAVVLITGIAKQMLEQQEVYCKNYQIIPHGCPKIDFVDGSAIKKSLGLDNRFVVSTFGLMSRWKGIEYAIRALPDVIKKEPNILYLVIGETHPQVRRIEGENYRNELTSLVNDLNLHDHVRFYNHFLSRHELIRYLQATDVYVTPYISANQISSGALTYALGAGKAVVSTPYFHAQEVLADNRGIFCKFTDPVSLADGISALLDNDYRRAIQKRVYDYSRRFLWPNVASKYCKLFNDILSEAPRASLFRKPK